MAQKERANESRVLQRMLSDSNIINRDCNDYQSSYKELQQMKTTCPITRQDHVIRKVNQSSFRNNKMRNSLSKIESNREQQSLFND